MDLVALKVIIEHRSEKLLLSSGIPSTVEQLHETVKETFGLIEDFTLHYLDEDFGDTKEQHELDRHQLIAESKKKDSTAIKDLMCRTFAHRRHDVISLQMSIEDIKDRWPVLFDVSQVSAEFQRITTLNLEPKFMSMLDFYSPKLLSMFQGKKGAVGERHRAKMSILLQSGIPIQRKREVIIRCLIDHLGEDASALIKDFEDAADAPVSVQEELAEEVMK
ncbi:hypothetical protein OYC64_013550 [Pagothenia borchgrevinki]|uniref:Uncharacterized protein n=1 Tax=Pagothenia borchgrevinki TaxID=8213 RepID=A0ABD2FUF2_PAGBO